MPLRIFRDSGDIIIKESKMEIEEVGLHGYEKGILIGKGSFGDVYKGLRRSDGKEVAIKQVEKCKIEEKQQLVELMRKSIQRQKSINELLKSINCPYFVQFIDCFDDQTNVYFIYEFCEGQTLRKLIENKTNQQKENFLLLAMYQILLTLQLLKQHKVIHRDIKPENILLSKGVAKIGDFGLARRIADPMTKGIGSSLTTAPEVFTEKYSYECDIWSLGVTIYNCLFGRYPFDRDFLTLIDQNEIKNRIKTNNFRIEIDESSQMSPILKKMIVKDPRERVTLESLLSGHPFKIELSNFRSNNACLRNCLFVISFLHFKGVQTGPDENVRGYIVAMTAFVAFSESVMIYKECKFMKTLKPEYAAPRQLVCLLMLCLASEINQLPNLKSIIDFMIQKHNGLYKEIALHLKGSNKTKSDLLSDLEGEIKAGPVFPRMSKLLTMIDGERTLMDILSKNQRFGECMKNIDTGQVKYLYKFYYEQISEFHKAIELI